MDTGKPKHVWFFSGVDQLHLDDNLGNSKEFGKQNFKYVPESELATLRAENERLRRELMAIQSLYEEGTIAHHRAKEALK